MGNDHKPPDDRVREWLATSGTALELRTARAFQRISGEVTHSRYYVAEDTKTLRETDIVAVVRGRPGPDNVILNFVVECKAGSDPWVLYESDFVYLRSDADLVDTFTVRSFGGLAPDNLARLYSAPVLHSTERHAYQIADTSKNNSYAYNAVRQVMDGVDGLVRDVPPIDLPTVLLFVPLVVTSAPIFKVALGGDGEPSVVATDRMLLLSRQRPEDQLRSIWVLGESAVEQFVTDARDSANAIFVQR